MDLPEAAQFADQMLQNKPQLPMVTEAWMAYLKTVPAIGGLVLLMLLDVISGLLCAVIAKTVSSSASWRGMLRKIMMLVMVLVGLIMEMIYSDIPWARLIAGFLCVTELISITENMGKAGIPLPKQLMETLAKLKQDQSGEKTLSLRAELSGIISGTPSQIQKMEQQAEVPKLEEPKDGEKSGIHQ